MAEIRRTWALLAVMMLLSAPLPGAEFSLQWQQWAAADTDAGDGDSDVPREYYGISYRHQMGPYQQHWLYSYEPIRLRAGEPASNSHLHRFRGETGARWGDWHLDLGVGVHGSSNRFKYQRFHEDMLVGEVAVIYGVSAPYLPAPGIAGDYRFGPFRWYPRLRWDGSVHDWQWRLDLPVAITLSSPEKRWQFAFERIGDKWSVLDQDREIRSKVYRHEWQLLARHRVWQHREQGPWLELGAGGSFSTRLEYLDLESGRRNESLGNAVFGQVRLGW